MWVDTQYIIYNSEKKSQQKFSKILKQAHMKE